MVPEFVHSVAAHAARAPQLAAYRDLLLAQPHVQAALAVRQCLVDPSRAFIAGFVDPLVELRQAGHIGTDVLLIIVDGLNEAAFHEPDYGDTIASFLGAQADRLPPWLKVITTVRTAQQDVVRALPFTRISLDKVTTSELIAHDIYAYVNRRIDLTPAIQNNIDTSGIRLEAVAQAKLVAHVAGLARGCFLYCKLLLDLIEYGPLVLKSSNYKILPINLAEIFLLQLSMRFQTTRSFEKVAAILDVCLASLYPLTADEIFETVNAGCLYRFVEWDDFRQRVDQLAGFLLQRRDSTYMFFHPAFREWLVRREETGNQKFLCDLR